MTMQSTDPIADLLTRIRNAAMVGKNEVRVPASKLKLTIAKELKKANYLSDVKVETAKPRDVIVITINKAGESCAINEISRISKPGRRVYVGHEDIPRVLSGLGVSILSTSQGVLTDKEARRRRVGGELLCEVW